MLFESEESRQASWIKEVKRRPKPAEVFQRQPPTMPQIGSCFERPIIPFVIKPRQLGRLFGEAMRREIDSARVVLVRERKAPIIPAFDRDLPDAAQTCRQPIPERAFLRERAHFNARAMRNAACSRKSRSSSVNAFSFSLSTSIKPTTFSASVITGTTISEFVLPNVGR